MTKKKSLGRMSIGGPKNTPTAYFDELCQISSILSSGLEQGLAFIFKDWQPKLKIRCVAIYIYIKNINMQF